MRTVRVVDQPGVGAHLVPGSPLIVGGRPTPAATAPTLGEHIHDVLKHRSTPSAGQIRPLPETDAPATSR